MGCGVRESALSLGRHFFFHRKKKLKEMVGERLRTARKAAGLSQTVLAKQVGISVYRLRQYEHDRQMPDEETLIALADALRVEPHFLLRQPMVREIRLLFACRIDESG